jgi:hypothetical protein
MAPCCPANRRATNLGLDLQPASLFQRPATARVCVRHPPAPPRRMPEPSSAGSNRPLASPSRGAGGQWRTPRPAPQAPRVRPVLPAAPPAQLIHRSAHARQFEPAPISARPNTSRPCPGPVSPPQGQQQLQGVHQDLVGKRCRLCLARGRQGHSAGSAGPGRAAPFPGTDSTLAGERRLAEVLVSPAADGPQPARRPCAIAETRSTNGSAPVGPWPDRRSRTDRRPPAGRRSPRRRPAALDRPPLAPASPWSDSTVYPAIRGSPPVRATSAGALR